MSQGRFPTKLVAVFFGVSLGATVAGSMVALLLGGVNSAAWSVLGLLVMWTPALGALVARRTVDRGWKARFPLKRWGRPRVFVFAVPVLVSLGVYGLARAAGVVAGASAWDPQWEGPGRIALNLSLNFLLVIPLGGLGALGEELGWRGYLQPRLEDAGVRAPLLWVGLMWTAFHLPVMLLGGYLGGASSGVFWIIFALATCNALSDSFLWGWACLRVRSVWPAVWFHCYHNWFSQFVFPKLFSGEENELMMGEHGVMATGAHAVFALLLLLWMRRSKTSWADLVRRSRAED